MKKKLIKLAMEMSDASDVYMDAGDVDASKIVEHWENKLWEIIAHKPKKKRKPRLTEFEKTLQQVGPLRAWLR